MTGMEKITEALSSDYYIITLEFENPEARVR